MYIYNIDRDRKIYRQRDREIERYRYRYSNHKKSPLFILIHLRVVSLSCLKQPSTTVFFKFHFTCTTF